MLQRNIFNTKLTRMYQVSNKDLVLHLSPPPFEKVDFNPG